MSLATEFPTCRWNLSCSFRGSSTQSQTKGIPVENQSSFHWIGYDPEALPHSPRKISPRTEVLLVYHALPDVPPEFDLLFHAENDHGTRIRVLYALIHFKDLCVSKVGKSPSPRLVHEHSVELDDYQGCRVSFTYNARKYPIQNGTEGVGKGGGDILLAIKEVRLEFYDIDRVKKLIALGGEKVTLRVLQKDYAGRPNTIATKGLGRSYVWSSDPTKGELHSTRQIEEELRDTTEIRLLSVTPTVHFHSSVVETVLHVPDNDEYANLAHMTTFLVSDSMNGEESSFMLEFFNFGYNPPKRRVVRLTYSEILAEYFKGTTIPRSRCTIIRRTLQKLGLSPVFKRRAPKMSKQVDFTTTRGATLTLSCTVTDMLEIEVSGISLYLPDYEGYFSEN